MGRRIVTDSHGDRWDVKDTGDGLRFSSPKGEEYAAPSDRRVDQMKNEDLVRLLDEARLEAGKDPVGEGGDGRGDPGGGY